MEYWKTTFIITIVIGLFATFAFGPAALVIPFIMIIILVIASVRKKPQIVYSKPQTVYRSEAEDEVGPGSRLYDSWNLETKKGGPFE